MFALNMSHNGSTLFPRLVSLMIDGHTFASQLIFFSGLEEIQFVGDVSNRKSTLISRFSSPALDVLIHIEGAAVLFQK